MKKFETKLNNLGNTLEPTLGVFSNLDMSHKFPRKVSFSYFNHLVIVIDTSRIPI